MRLIVEHIYTIRDDSMILIGDTVSWKASPETDKAQGTVEKIINGEALVCGLQCGEGYQRVVTRWIPLTQLRKLERLGIL